MCVYVYIYIYIYAYIYIYIYMRSVLAGDRVVVLGVRVLGGAPRLAHLPRLDK